MHSYRKLLLVQTGFIGDLVLSTPVISVLHEKYPEAEIHVMCTRISAPLLRNHRLVTNVVEFDKRGRDSGFGGLIRKARELRSHGYDAVFSLHKSYRTALLLFLSGISERFGFRESSLSFLYTRTAPRKDLSHEVLRNLALLRVLDIEPDQVSCPMSLDCSEEQVLEASELLSGLKHPFVAIAPGSVWRTKRWTKEGFSELAARLVSAGRGVVLIGGPDDRESGDYIADSLSSACTEGRDFVNLLGKTSLMTSAAVLGRCQCLITNDSAPLHIAAAMGTPVVAVFCATVPEFGFTPWKVAHRIVEKKELSCRPCGSHGGHVCPLGTDACQFEITAGQVWKEVEDLCAEIRVAA